MQICVDTRTQSYTSETRVVTQDLVKTRALRILQNVFSYSAFQYGVHAINLA